MAEGLGVVYLADPVCDDPDALPPLELYTVTFHAPYYSTTQGIPPLPPFSFPQPPN